MVQRQTDPLANSFKQVSLLQPEKQGAVGEKRKDRLSVDYRIRTLSFTLKSHTYYCQVIRFPLFLFLFLVIALYIMSSKLTNDILDGSALRGLSLDDEKLTDKKHKKIVSVQGRVQWEQDHGYCGETSL